MIGGEALNRLRMRLLSRTIRRPAAEAGERDALTGLLTYTGLIQTGAGVSSGAASVVLLDLDHFRRINTALDTAAGDRVLVAVANRIEALAPPGAMAARVGIDEFAIVLRPGGAEEGRQLAERLSEQIALPIDAGDGEIVVSTATGVATVAPGEPLENALRRAGAAMAHAGQPGLRRSVQPYAPEMSDNLRHRFTLERELRQALNAGQLRLYYQPLVDLATHIPLELEALIRWEHPERGTLLPADFLFAVESNGLQREIGRWVLREACRQGREWLERSDGRRMVIAANLSPSQLRDPGLLDDITAILGETGFDPAFLRLEISEAVTLDEIEPAIAFMRGARELGVLLALDDFGAGYAGWALLRRSTVDAIKLDRSFLTVGEHESPDRIKMVEALAAFARRLGVPVSIEGIERAEQASAMRALGIDQAQGFYFAVPQPAHRIAPLLTGAPLRPIV